MTTSDKNSAAPRGQSTALHRPPGRYNVDRRHVDQLLARVSLRDVDAFTELYDTISATVYGVALRVSRDQHMAEEISQETFMQVWHQAHTFDSTKGSAKGWVTMLSHRRAVDTIRRSQASRDRDARFMRLVDRDFDVVAETAQTAAEYREIRSCISSLTNLQRESVMLAYYEGLTYLQISQQLGVNKATIKTRMRDGLVRLRTCISEQPVTDPTV